MLKRLQRRYFSSFINKNWYGGCEECPEKESTKYVVQKSCGPSIFEVWKPKVPELTCDVSKNKALAPPNFSKTCFAGMQTCKPDRCVSDALARECQKRNHPKWLARCPPMSKYEIQLKGELPPLIEGKAKCKASKGKEVKKASAKSMRKSCIGKIPAPDWNPNGVLY